MSNDFICPNPKRWNEIFNDLCKEYEKAIRLKLPHTVMEIRKAGGPPTPLILDGWWYSSNLEKSIRWKETIEWAEKNNLLAWTIVDEKDKYYL